jgi:hypothetical protein
MAAEIPPPPIYLILIPQMRNVIQDVNHNTRNAIAAITELPRDGIDVTIFSLENIGRWYNHVQKEGLKGTYGPNFDFDDFIWRADDFSNASDDQTQAIILYSSFLDLLDWQKRILTIMSKRPPDVSPSLYAAEELVELTLEMYTILPKIRRATSDLTRTLTSIPKFRNDQNMMVKIQSFNLHPAMMLAHYGNRFKILLEVLIDNFEKHIRSLIGDAESFPSPASYADFPKPNWDERYRNDAFPDLELGAITDYDIGGMIQGQHAPQARNLLRAWVYMKLFRDSMDLAQARMVDRRQTEGNYTSRFILLANVLKHVIRENKM